MFYLFQSSPVSVPVWLTILIAVIAASGTWLTLFVNRKKRGNVRAEESKLRAEARHLEIQSLSEVYQQLRETRTELAQIVKDGNERIKEARKRENFLRDQVRYHEELTILARQAAHAAINEIQRCVIAIQLRDDLIAEIRKRIPDVPHVPVFEQKQHEEIVNYQALPLPPDCPLRNTGPLDEEEIA